MDTDLSSYYISCTGKLCIAFPPDFDKNPELCEVVGCQNETWFIHNEIK